MEASVRLTGRLEQAKGLNLVTDDDDDDKIIGCGRQRIENTDTLCNTNQDANHSTATSSNLIISP
jgi:hypothetical protein